MLAKIQKISFGAKLGATSRLTPVLAWGTQPFIFFCELLLWTCEKKTDRVNDAVKLCMCAHRNRELSGCWDHIPLWYVKNSVGQLAATSNSVTPVKSIPEAMADFERIRLVILGGAGVGKSCIVKRFLFKTYTDKYRATVEDLYNREYDLGSVTLKVRQ